MDHINSYNIIHFNIILLKGWRWAYYLSGMPGFVLAFLMLLTLVDPRKRMESYTAVKRAEEAENETTSSEDNIQEVARTSIWNDIIKPFFHPCVLTLLLGACIRQTAGYSWGNNSQLY